MTKINLIDRSNYFKGLLLLIRKDNKVAPSEERLITKVGLALGFEKSFIRTAISEILENENILDDPPSFSDPMITKSFLKDGLKISASDNDIDPNELYWLKEIAKINSVPEHWLDNQLKHLVENKDLILEDLEVQNRFVLSGEF
ncbi:MAG: hypothetical protein K9J12_10840 [Melioribacteraceae bacterium]|nr:hypothetical protein [Melioribacteraceae bacterium]MCF8264314.1 hypothetical protein [Melioribacteraceae bacterium]MCF8431425.1 hypothetical protein [Melioribacteraceae bacterium]